MLQHKINNILRNKLSDLMRLRVLFSLTGCWTTIPSTLSTIEHSQKNPRVQLWVRSSCCLAWV